MGEGGDFKGLLEKNKPGILKLGRKLFSCPELGFKEVKSNRILTSFLLENGISFTTGICRTGIKATIGAGEGVHVALVADMDALEVKDGEGRAVVHSCGHSIQTTVMAYVLKMIKDSGILDRCGGKVSFIAAPAEEFIDFEFRTELMKQGEIKYFSGKQNMISDGVFDGVDCVLSMHVNGESETLFDVGSTLAGFMVKNVKILGQAAHSGAAPHQGKNALHGANLFMNAVSYMKEQFSKEAGLQIHPVISCCSGGVNVIPDEVELSSYVRANTLEAVLEAGEKFDNCANYSAKALGLDCEIENRTGYMPLKQSERINALVYENMRKLCGDDKILRDVVSGASGDIGDLGYLLPSVQFGFSGIKGRIHSAEFEIEDEENVYFNTAQILMDTVADLLSDPSFKNDQKEYEKRREFYLKNWLCEQQTNCDVSDGN